MSQPNKTEFELEDIISTNLSKIDALINSIVGEGFDGFKCMNEDNQSSGRLSQIPLLSEAALWQLLPW